MSKTCKNCGNIFEDHMNICPRCGMQYVADNTPQYTAVPYDNTNQPQNQYAQPGAYNQQGYQQQAYGQQGYQQSAYRPYPAANEEMTVGNWVATIILTNLGIIGLILLFVWGFSDNVPKAKKNYCRAMLIMNAIAIGLIIILMILLSWAGVSFLDSLSGGGHYYYS